MAVLHSRRYIGAKNALTEWTKPPRKRYFPRCEGLDLARAPAGSANAAGKFVALDGVSFCHRFAPSPHPITAVKRTREERTR